MFLEEGVRRHKSNPTICFFQDSELKDELDGNRHDIATNYPHGGIKPPRVKGLIGKESNDWEYIWKESEGTKKNGCTD
jgi:hypothetical protein